MTKLSIGIVTRGLRINPNSINEGGVGGSETAFIYIAQELAKLGHSVRAFCECDAPGQYGENLQFFNHDAFVAQTSAMQFDVLIASRWHQYLTIPVPCGLRILWAHDMPAGSPSDLMANLWQTDKVFLLSDYHIEQYKKFCPDLGPHIFKTANGLDLDLIDNCKMPKIDNKLIYTSRPERGLDILLEKIFPLLLRFKPDLHLYYANYDISSLSNVPEEVLAKLQKVHALTAKYKGRVHNLGHLNKQQLYQQMSSSKLLVNPTTFPEIFGITYTEAQACGTPVVTTKAFALEETVGDNRCGLLIDGNPLEDSYVEAFVAQTLRLLDDRETYAKFSEEGPKFVRERGYDWSAIAKAWTSKFEEMLEERWTNNKDRIITQLERNHDLIPAKLICNSLGHPRKAALQEKINNIKEEEYSSTEQVVDLWKSSLPRFHSVSEILKHAGLTPTKVLDFASGEASFGLFFKKQLPSCEVVILDKDPVVVEHLQAYAKSNNLEVSIDVASHPSEVGSQYDLIFVGNYIDTLENPQDFIEKLGKKLTKQGLIVLTTRFGPSTATVPTQHDRVWNFQYQDFVDMFGECERFTATFMDDKFSDGGDLRGFWVVLVHPDAKIGKVNLQRKVRTTRPYQSLAVCMIAKNEEDWLSGCLKSVSKIADKIVLVDSKSNDKTVDIARSFGAEVRTIDFDTFDKARNESIRDVNTDWILWLDADERLRNPDKLRKYLQATVFEGFALRQIHLMADAPQSFDLPIRVFRNRPIYKFTGAIHEHCERIDRQPYGDPISPALALEDCDLPHYGYMDEKVRRIKCSGRNMKLLQRDVEEHGVNGRELTWVLVIRDYLNMVKWDVEKVGFPIQEGSKQHQLLCAAVDTYLEHFGGKKSKFEAQAFPMYQEALQALGMSGLCYNDLPRPPFEIGFGLVGSPAGELNPQTLGTTVKGRWFLNDDEFLNFVKQQSQQLVVGLGISDPTKFEDFDKLPTASLPYISSDAKQLLSHGVGLFS